jgi:hypothetical protein
MKLTDVAFLCFLILIRLARNDCEKLSNKHKGEFAGVT